jgi:hypothetical protein
MTAKTRTFFLLLKTITAKITSAVTKPDREPVRIRAYPDKVIIGMYRNLTTLWHEGIK